jgi:hypothetical protein
MLSALWKLVLILSRWRERIKCYTGVLLFADGICCLGLLLEGIYLCVIKAVDLLKRVTVISRYGVQALRLYKQDIS